MPTVESLEKLLSGLELSPADRVHTLVCFKGCDADQPIGRRELPGRYYAMVQNEENRFFESEDLATTYLAQFE